MADYNEQSVEELRAEASSRELEGRSKLTTKDELVKALEADDAADGSEDESASASEEQDELREEYQDYVEEHKDEDRPSIGHESEASDPENPVVEAELEDKEAYEDLTDTDKELADLALDASGPLNVESPYGRVMTGAVSEDDAKDQEKELAKVPDEYPRDLPLPERVSDEFAEEAQAYVDRESGYDDVQQEDVVDFPAPVGEREEAAEERASERREELNEDRRSGSEDLRKQNVAETQGDEGEMVAAWRPFDQRAVMYTDGLSGGAEHNLERSYRVTELRSGLGESNLKRRSGGLAEEVAEAEAKRNQSYEDE